MSQSNSVKKFFLGFCEKNLNFTLEKRRFIEKTVSDMIEGKLYELTLMVMENNKIFIIDRVTEVYSIYSLSNKNRDEKLINIEMEECISVLKKVHKYVKDDIIIFQVEYKNPEFKIPIVEYNLFSSYGVKKLTLNHCRNLKAHYYIPKTIENFQDYKYNPNNIFYYDRCLPYSNEDNTDLTIYDRKYEFNMNNMALCENGCVFKKYANNLIKCECDIKVKFNSFLNSYTNKSKTIYKFDIKEEINLNFWVIKCLLIIFDKQVILSNLISAIVLGIIFLNLIGSALFYLIESKVLYNKIKNFIKTLNKKKDKNKKPNINKTMPDKKITNKNNAKNPPKKNNMKNKQYNINVYARNRQRKKSMNFNKKNSSLSSILKKAKKNSKSLNKKFNYKDRTYNELNILSFNDAIIQDRRTFVQFYISQIMTKQLILFAVHCRKDYNSKIIKILFFFYILAIFLFMNTLFITESVLHEIFIFKGIVGIFYYFRRMIIITAFSLLIKNIIMLYFFTENDVVSLREENETDKTDKTEKIRKMFTSVTMKSCLFFVFSLFSLLFIWIYLACFYSVFKKTQFFALRNTLITFGTSLVVPIILGVIPCMIRSFALSNRESKNRICAYYFSRALQIIM